jgi:predicted GIY-YIG superfamily endonuclease
VEVNSAIDPDLKKRFATHNAGENISTKPFRPWEIAWYAGLPNQQTARDFEKYLQHFSPDPQLF